MTIAQATTHRERIALLRDAMQKLKVLKEQRRESMKKRNVKQQMARLKGYDDNPYITRRKPCVAVFPHDMSIVKFATFVEATTALDGSNGLAGKLAALNKEILTYGKVSKPCRRPRHKEFIIHNGAIIFSEDDYNLYQNRIKAMI